MILPIFVAGILTLGILAATANAQESNNTGNAATPPAPGVDCTANPNDPACAPAATPTPPPQTPTSGCGPGTDNSTCSATPTPTPVPTPTSGCGPGTDNSTCSATPTPTTTPTPGNASSSQQSNNTGNASADFVNTILAVHNRERAAVGVPPLVWSDKLAADAKTWAEHLAATGKFEHSTCCGAFRAYGENLAGFYRRSAHDRGTGGLDLRKEGLSRRPVPAHRSEWFSRSLHADGLADHERGRLRDRQWWWSSIQHSGVPLQPAGQHLWAEAVLGEPHSCHGKYPTITRYQGYGRSCSKQWYSEER